MSEMENFVVEVRERTGTGAARATRRAGRVPGTLYGGGEPPVSLDMSFNQVKKAYLAGSFAQRLAKLTHEGKEQLVIARDVQLDPVKDLPIHVDLMRVDDKTMINVEVAVRFINEEQSPGIKRGGVLNIVRHTVELLCPATAIPEYLEGDLTGLDINDGLHISAFTLPEGVRPTITDRDFTVATIAPPSGGASGEEETEDGETAEVPTVAETEAEAEAGENDED